MGNACVPEAITSPRLGSLSAWPVCVSEPGTCHRNVIVNTASSLGAVDEPVRASGRGRLALPGLSFSLLL